MLKFIFFVLFIGSQLSYAGPFDTPVAMITSFDGKVSFENSTDRNVDFGTDLFIGDILKTGKNANLLLTFYDGCRQEILDQKSLIQISKHHSVLRSGKFKTITTLDCNVPQAILQEEDSHLKAGLVIRGVNNISSSKNTVKSTLEAPLSPNQIESLINKNSFHLKAWTNHGKSSLVNVKINSPILIHFLAEQDSYIIINYYTSSGQRHSLTSALPLAQGKILANKLYTLGNTGISLFATLPIGTDMVHIMTSNAPILIPDNNEGNTKRYYEKLALFIKNNPQQKFSEKQIKLKIIQ